MFIKKNNPAPVTRKQATGITPFRFVSSVLHNLGVTINNKRIKYECLLAKKLLERLRDSGYDDQEITQIISYTCDGMVKTASPHDFRYFYGILNNWLDSAVSQQVRANVQDISLFLSGAEPDVDNPI